VARWVRCGRSVAASSSYFFAVTRVRRNHERPRSNGLIERAQSTVPQFTPRRERASAKALTLIRRNSGDSLCLVSIPLE
jgi:hypothetical protein